jgi:uncharacterized integral membrane protein
MVRTTALTRFKAVVAAILIAIVLVFVFQNLVIVDIDFLFWTLQANRAAVLFSVFGAGIVVGWLACALKRRRAKSQSL